MSLLHLNLSYYTDPYNRTLILKYTYSYIYVFTQMQSRHGHTYTSHPTYGTSVHSCTTPRISITAKVRHPTFLAQLSIIGASSMTPSHHSSSVRADHTADQASHCPVPLRRLSTPIIPLARWCVVLFPRHCTVPSTTALAASVSPSGTAST